MPSIHKKNEDEWFAKNEKELIKNLQRERRKREQVLAEKLKEEEARKRRDLHWMKCPKCGSDMRQEELESIKIERCTVCDGVYLDRQELEELMLKKNEERRSIARRLLGMFS